MINAPYIEFGNAAEFTVNAGPGPVQLLMASSNISGGYLWKEGTGTMLMTSTGDTYYGTTMILGGTLVYASTGSCPMYTSPGNEQGAGNKVMVWPGAAGGVSGRRQRVVFDGGLVAGQLNTLLTNMVNYPYGNFNPLPGFHEDAGGGWQPGSTLALDTTYAAGGFDYPYAITGNMALLKSGPNTLAADGNSTYSGSTTIAAGTLVVTGSLLKHGSVAVQGGAGRHGQRRLG